MWADHVPCRGVPGLWESVRPLRPLRERPAGHDPVRGVRLTLLRKSAAGSCTAPGRPARAGAPASLRLSRSSIYTNFGNKQALCVAVLRR